MVGLFRQQLTIQLPPVGQRAVIGQRPSEHPCAVGIPIVRKPRIVNPHLGIGNTAALQPNGDRGVAEISVHHIGNGGIVLAHAVHHHTQQPAAALLMVTVKHLQGKEVVGRRAQVVVKYDARQAVVCHRLHLLARAGGQHYAQHHCEKQLKQSIHNKSSIIKHPT